MLSGTGDNGRPIVLTRGGQCTHIYLSLLESPRLTPASEMIDSTKLAASGTCCTVLGAQPSCDRQAGLIILPWNMDDGCQEITRHIK